MDSNQNTINPPPTSLKRSRSMSSMQCLPSLSAESDAESSKGMPVRQPKRLRRSKSEDVPTTHELMANRNAMSRKALKREAKKARRMNRIRGGEGQAKGNGMDVDDALNETFMATHID